MYYNFLSLENNFKMNEWVLFFELKNIKFFYKVTKEMNPLGEYEYLAAIKSKKNNERVYTGYSDTIKFTGNQTHEDCLYYVFLLFESIIENHYNVPKQLSRIAMSDDISGNIEHCNKVILTNLKTAGFFTGIKNNLFLLDNDVIISFEESHFKNSVLIFEIKYKKDSISLYKHGIIVEKEDNLHDINIFANHLIKNNTLNGNNELLLKLLSE